MNNQENKVIINNHIIRISEVDFDKFIDVFNRGKVRADSYCPTPDECDDILLKNLSKYIPFMLWIEETGYETEENAENRKYLRHLLYSRMLVP